MKLIQILFISSVMLGSFACKCHKDAAAKTSSTNSLSQSSPSTTSNTSSTTNTTTTQTIPFASTNKTPGDSAASVYRVAVSFISFGAGTDPDGRPILDHYVQQYMDATSKKIIYDAHPWGREGEIDICFTLDNLSVEEQKTFIVGLKETFKGHELVHILENKQNNYRR